MDKQMPKNWVETCLGNLAQVQSGGTPSRSNKDYWNGNIPWVKISDIKEIYVDETTEFITEEGLKNSSARIFPKGTILFTIFATLGKIGILNIDAATNQAIAGITPSKFIDDKYLTYSLIDLSNSISEYGKGVAQKNINQAILKDTLIPLPPLTEQNRIVAKLDTLFAQLETIKTSMEKIPVLLKNFRQQVLTQAVTGKLTEEWRKGKDLESGEDFLKRVIKLRKEKTFRKLPGLEYKMLDHPYKVDESWTFGLLQNFGELTRGKSKHRPRNDEKLFGGDFPFIQTGEISRSNGLITNYKNTYSEFGLAQSRLFPKGTLCITIAANIAETGILDFDACFPDSVVGYLPFENSYSSKFAMFYFNTIQQDLEHYAPATAQKNINLGILFDVAFPVPPLEEQQEIVSRVESLFAKADAIEKQYETLKQKIDTLPQAILHKAFKGELTEQLDSDGDARELLKEIQELKNATKVTKNVKLEKLKSFKEKVKLS
ncbi:restriction endonuclease subunit S [Flavobacterium sp. DGU38]|uniref:Restriction endonuclease subunit S n=1 Tax=Flavobacterium calami TaxID=3139144 RepID=A0ABU9IQM8_9FLAO